MTIGLPADDRDSRLSAASPLRSLAPAKASEPRLERKIAIA